MTKKRPQKAKGKATAPEGDCVIPPVLPSLIYDRACTRLRICGEEEVASVREGRAAIVVLGEGTCFVQELLCRVLCRLVGEEVFAKRIERCLVDLPLVVHTTGGALPIRESFGTEQLIRRFWSTMFCAS